MTTQTPKAVPLLTYGQGSPDVFFRFDVPKDGTFSFRPADTSFYGDGALHAVLSLHYGACPTLQFILRRLVLSDGAQEAPRLPVT